ncbi:Alpha-L-arabinofuranosidase 1 [Diplonema papillatum]|nr:Alpha-L-arabinofuranosidase 1 [Diplonema papillatum]
MMFQAALAVAVLAQNTATVHNTKGAAIKTNHFSMFYETEINFGGEGGLYGELVWNRDFEALGRGKLSVDDPPARASRDERVAELRQMRRQAAEEPASVGDQLDPGEPAAVPGVIAPWTAVGGVSAKSVNTTQPFMSNPWVVSFTASAAGQGIENPGYWGMNLRTETAFDFSFYGMGNGAVMYAQLMCGTQVISESPKFEPMTSQWQMFNASLQPTSPCFGGSLRVLTATPNVAIYLDHVSMFPGDAVLGLFRPDLFAFLKEYAPPMMRLPGGNYLEGTGPRTRWQWKRSIGPKETRSGHYNSAWRYWVTDGLGLMELLRLTEHLNAQPLVSIYTGFSLGRQYVPLNESQQFVDDAMDLMEYSNGGVNTVWGQRRVEDGHPTSFNVSMLEIGNEETQQGQEGYGGHYKIIMDPLRQKYPDIFIVASGLEIATNGGRSTSCLPCVGGCDMAPQHCDAWDEHTYDNATSMASLVDLYDNYYSPSFCQTVNGTQCPPVYVLEFACAFQPLTIQSAVAEGMFLIGTERNADVVHATAFAPLFVNVRGQQWGYNLINFNASHVFALPSYSSQLILKRSIGDHTLQTNISSHEQGVQRWSAIASFKGTNTVIVKVANFEFLNFTVDISFEGFPSPLTFPSTANYMGSSDASMANTLDNPNVVSITSVPLKVNGQTVSITMDTYAVAVFEATLNA